MVELCGIALVFIASMYGHKKEAEKSNIKTIEAVKEQIQSFREEFKADIQSVRNDVMEDRMDSKAADEEMHAELLLFKQESTAAWEKQLQATNAAIDKTLAVYSAKTDERLVELTREVREHNNFAVKIPVMEKQVELLEKHLKTLGG